MAYIQQNTPPPNKILNFSLPNFVGGLNNRSELLEMNQCSDVLNMTFSDDTVMEKRRGTTYFDTLNIGGTEITYIDEYKPYNDTDILVRASSTELYIGNTKILNINGQMTGVNYLGKYFIADGARYWVYGKFPQATTTYEKVTGTPTPNYTLMQVVNPPVGYTPLGTTHFKGVMNYNFTTGQCWYEPCQNELNDVYKNGNVLPEKPRFITVHNGRIYASGSDKDNDNVFITDIHNPYYFPASTALQLPPNSDRVVGLQVYDNSVVVGRRKDIYYISGETNNPQLGLSMFKLKQLNSHTGWASQFAVNVAHNYLFFLGTDGNAYALANASNNNDNLQSSVLTRTVDIFKAPVSLKKEDLWTAHSIFFDDKWYITMKDKILIYSYRLQAWTLYSGINARSFYDFQDILIWGDDKGRTCMVSENFLDHGVPYKAYWRSKNFDMNDSNSFKQFREFYLVAHTFEDFSSDVSLTFEVDYTDVKNRVVITNQLSIWGKSKWGDRFINRNINASLPFVIGRRGRTIRFTFSNGYNVDTTVVNVSDLDSVTGRIEGFLAYVSSVNKYYLFTDGAWKLLTDSDINQTMKVYQINGDYEMRGKR